MVIHAIFENGVFRPVERVELPERCEVELQINEPVRKNPQTLATTPLSGLAAIATRHPDNPALPSDLAEQHDHYLYGTPKRP